jgi:hypothetical protein
MVYWDAATPGFGVKVTPRGRKVFLVMYRIAGAGSRLRKYTIGPYGRITLPMARAQAQKIFAARLDGRDPAEEKKQSRRRLVVDRIDDLVERFIQEHVSRVGTSKRLTNLLPYWGTKSVHEIKKRDVSDLVSLIAQRNANASYRLLKTLKTFFRWCIGRAVIDFSPAEGLSTGYREISRDRVLTDQELAAVILGARLMPHPYGGIVELLALTGQRREEVTQLRRNELDEKARTWSIPVLERRTRRRTSCISRNPRGDWSQGTLRATWSLGLQEENAFRRLPKENARSINDVELRDGGCTICGEQSFQGWRA